MVLRFRPALLVWFTSLSVVSSLASAESGPAPLALRAGPYSLNSTTTGGTIRFEVDPATKPGTRFTVELEGGVKGQSLVSVENTPLRNVTVTGLQPDHTYAYVVTSEGKRSTKAVLTTAPSSNAPFAFLIYGDNRTDDPAHAAVAKGLAAAPGAFLVNTGDLVEEGSRADDWQRFFQIEREVLARRPLFACIGNHELYRNGGVEYAQYFGDPSAMGQAPIFFNATFRWGAARFFLLNSMTSFASGTKDRTWLDAELEKSSAEPGLEFRFIVMHHGLYSSGPHGNNKRLIDEGLPELFRKQHIDALFAGHDHLYERGLESGLRYVVTGGGGAPSYDIKKLRAGSKKTESVRHFIEAKVDGSTFSMTVRRVDGSVLESCGFSKVGGAFWDCDAATPAPPAPPVASVKVSEPAAQESPPARTGSCSCNVGMCTQNTGLSLSLGLGLVSIMLLRKRRR
jgi:acid phosphatase type 7